MLNFSRKTDLDFQTCNSRKQLKLRVNLKKCLTERLGPLSSSIASVTGAATISAKEIDFGFLQKVLQRILVSISKEETSFFALKASRKLSKKKIATNFLEL